MGNPFCGKVSPVQIAEYSSVIKGRGYIRGLNLLNCEVTESIGEIMSRVIIVEGKSDKKRLLEVLDEPVEIACTNGTLGLDKLEELITEYSGDEVCVLLDADNAGDKARRLFKHEFPNVRHVYTHRMYREVATTPLNVLAQILEGAHFAVKMPEGEEENNSRRAYNRINDIRGKQNEQLDF